MTTQDRPAVRPAGVDGASGIDDVARVLARMCGLAAAWPPQDGLAVFNRVYLAVTCEIHEQIAAGRFPDPDRTARLTAGFARRYLHAVDADAAGRPVPPCWQPLMQLRRHAGVRPLQFALAGINAHVGHDLPLAVVDAARLLGVAPAAIHRDFECVGNVLTALEERIREDLMPGPDLLERAEPLTHLVGCWNLEQARDAAWTASRVLWRLRDRPGLYAEFAAGLDATAGLVGRCLLTPW